MEFIQKNYSAQSANRLHFEKAIKIMKVKELSTKVNKVHKVPRSEIKCNCDV